MTSSVLNNISQQKSIPESFHSKGELVVRREIGTRATCKSEIINVYSGTSDKGYSVLRTQLEKNKSIMDKFSCAKTMTISYRYTFSIYADYGCVQMYVHMCGRCM